MPTAKSNQIACEDLYYYIVALNTLEQGTAVLQNGCNVLKFACSFCRFSFEQRHSSWPTMGSDIRNVSAQTRVGTYLVYL